MSDQTLFLRAHGGEKRHGLLFCAVQIIIIKIITVVNVFIFSYVLPFLYFIFTVRNLAHNFI